MKTSLTAAIVVLSSACAELPRTPPPLAGMQEPVELLQEPADEAQRLELDAGGFTGVVVGDARASLDAMLAEPEGVLVTAVVENSPGDFAGLSEGDLLLEVSGREELALHWPSEWRRVELEAEPGSKLRVVYDRAGAEFDAEVLVEKRLRHPERLETQRFREEQRVGVVFRSATEVEARAAAVGVGGGAVIVGLTLESPWRAERGRSGGVVYGDLVRAVDGVEVAHPQVLLDAIRAAGSEDKLDLEIVRAGQIVSIRAPLSQRAEDITRIKLQPLFGLEHENGVWDFSVLLGLIGWEKTPAAWELRLLWLFTIRGGDEDRLESSES